MKKIFAMILAVVMVLSMTACGGKNNTETTAPEATVTVGSALEVLENIWAKYGEDEKFAVIGGNMESPVDGAPGNYDMACAENLTWNLLVPEAEIANIDEAATMIHMMNANTFTCGVVHMAEGADATTFGNTMREAVQGNQWMCGFPDQLTIAVIGGEYVLVAFGVNDAMTPFMNHFAEAYPEVEVLVNEAIAG